MPILDRDPLVHLEKMQFAVLAVVTGACIAVAGLSWWGGAGPTQSGVTSVAALFSTIILARVWSIRKWWRR